MLEPQSDQVVDILRNSFERKIYIEINEIGARPDFSN